MDSSTHRLAAQAPNNQFYIVFGHMNFSEFAERPDPKLLGFLNCRNFFLQWPPAAKFPIDVSRPQHLHRVPEPVVASIVGIPVLFL